MILTRRAAPVTASLAAALLIGGLATPLPGDAADHLDAPGGMSPSGDAQSDINDLHVFAGAGGNTVMSMTVHPVATAESTFGADVEYKFNVDTDTETSATEFYTSDGDANVSYEVEFSDVTASGSQSLYVTRTEGDQSNVVAFGRVGETLEVNGGGQIFTGLRSDPFFFDLLAFREVVGNTPPDATPLVDDESSDFFDPLDTLAIVLEVPDEQLDSGDPISVWATTAMDEDGDGEPDQVDRMGRPAINTAITDTGPIIEADEFTGLDNIKEVYNELPTDPTDRAEETNDLVVGLIKNSISIYSSLDDEGSYTDAQLDALVAVFSPDVLPFDKGSDLPPPIQSRPLDADVIDTSLTLLTGGDPLGIFDDRDETGAINTDGVGPHDDYLDSFPYLGEPNGADKVEVDNVDNFRAELQGSNEVPPVATDASGVSALSFNDQGDLLSHLEVTYGLEDVAAAHIHVGDDNENGPVVTFLYDPDSPTTDDGTLADDSVDASDLIAGDMENLEDVLNDGFAYVNVHTTENPGGEIRGQVDALETRNFFSDDDGGIHEDNIEIIAAAQITVGCNAAGTLFCPTNPTTRGQMAAFLNRALNLPDTTQDFFSDDDGSPYEQDINRLAAAGITQGTSASRFSPTQLVTRGEMAAFIARAWDLPESDTDYFSDDDGTIFEADINAIAEAGITSGTSGDTYEPAGTQTRGQMATFLAGAFGWEGSTRFTVTVENVSTPGTVDTERANGVVPLSPGAFVTFEGDDPAFTPGELADSGTRLIAEDGFPAPLPFISDDTEVEILQGLDSALRVGTFASPGGTPDLPALFPGESATFSFRASQGQRLQLETMFVQSNDWFLAFGDGGLELFDGNAPISGDVTSEIALYDAGTEIDAAPGQGPSSPPGAVQKPVQDPMATNVGTDESLGIQLARDRHPTFDIPANAEVIRVTVTSD